jgi:hypothetical protein
MLFQTPPTNADHVRAFCGLFNEGIRVEYKSNFDESVRRALPKIVSSFANSLGGVVILGVNAVNGVPQNPIEGFEPPSREEIPLTIENICIQNIHPAIFPRIIEVPSDVAGRKFFVIEVDESVEAPHAIENSTKVNVRTGAAANPYELADVDSVIELLRRREDPTSRRQRMLDSIHIGLVHPDSNHVQITICPVFPRAPVCVVEDCWEFLSTIAFRGRLFFPAETLRRVEYGVAAFVPERRGTIPAEGGDLNIYGLVSRRKQLATYELPNREGGAVQNYLAFGDVFQPWVKAFVCASWFFKTVGHRADVMVEVRMKNLMGISVPFVNFENRALNDFRCCDNEIGASHIVAAENMLANIEPITHKLFAQLCWPLWQAADNFPTDALNAQSSVYLRNQGLLG